MITSIIDEEERELSLVTTNEDDYIQIQIRQDGHDAYIDLSKEGAKLLVKALVRLIEN
jgi:hypothetical protein